MKQRGTSKTVFKFCFVLIYFVGVILAWIATGNIPYSRNKALIFFSHVAIPTTVWAIGYFLHRNRAKRMMGYQLTFEFPCNSVDDYDAMLPFERRLTILLSKKHFVKKHTLEAGKLDVFVDTYDDKKLLSDLETFIVDSQFANKIRAAYRKVSTDKFTYLVSQTAN